MISVENNSETTGTAAMDIQQRLNSLIEIVGDPQELQKAISCITTAQVIDIFTILFDDESDGAITIKKLLGERGDIRALRNSCRY